MTTRIDLARASDVGGVPSGTSNPVSPADGDLFYRSDLDLLIRYRSTGTRWVSADPLTAQFTGQGAGPITAGGTSGGGFPTWHTDHDLWLDDFIVMMRVLTTNDGANFWTANLRKINQDVSTVTTIASPNTSAQTVNHFVTQKTAIDALLGTTFKVLDIVANSTSGPGPLHLYSMLTYRLVVT